LLARKKVVLFATPGKEKPVDLESLRERGGRTKIRLQKKKGGGCAKARRKSVGSSCKKRYALAEHDYTCSYEFGVRDGHGVKNYEVVVH